MRGRKPKPTALRILQGNPGHRPDDGRREVSMPAGTPEPPAHLSAGAKQEFFRLVKYLAQVHGLLTPADTAVLGVYCSYYDQWQQAEEVIPSIRTRLRKVESELDALSKRRRRAPKGAIPADEKTLGRLRNDLNLAIGERNKARKEMRLYLQEVGLTPAARSSLRVSAGQKEFDFGTMAGADRPPDNPLDAARRALTGA